MSTMTDLFSEAAKTMGINYSFLGMDHSVLVLHFPTKDHFIVNTRLGLISNSEEVMGLDKAYQYELLKEKKIQPITKSYLDINSKYAKRSTPSHEEIAIDILSNFSFPFILKKNRGQEGRNVFLVSTEAELSEKIEVIFNIKDNEYDYVLLAQEYIEARSEYRIISYNQEISLVYCKDNSQAIFQGNISPLHWQNAKAVEVSDSTKIESLNQFCRKIFSIWPLKYGGLDIIEDKNGNYWLIEVNTSPSVALFVKDNGVEKVLRLYKHILGDLSRAHR